MDKCTSRNEYASAGVANSFLKASNVKRTRHAHHVTASALHTLLQNAYNLFKEREMNEDTLTIEDWCKKSSASSPQFQFWHITLQLELVYLQLVGSLRESSFSLNWKAFSSWCHGSLHWIRQTIRGGCQCICETW